MIRAFIAIDLPWDASAAIAEAQIRLKRAHVGVKVSWTKIENVHLTLQFLGHIDGAKLERIEHALRDVVIHHKPFEITIQGAGGFPDERQPRVIWIGCQDPEGKLETLARAVQESMRPLGLKPEHREFSAHLTLGRIKMPRPDVALTRAIDSLKNSVFGTLRVDSFHLYESQLHPEGSIYKQIASFFLIGP